MQANARHIAKLLFSRLDLSHIKGLDVAASSSWMEKVDKVLKDVALH